MIIAIGGVSTAGKTTLASRLREHFQDRNVSLLCQDDFVFPVEQIPRIKNRVDWEHPDSIDHQKLLQAILAEHKQNDIVIVEGLMVFWHEESRKHFDKCIYIEISRSLFLERKSVDTRWGYEPKWYVEHIWKSFRKYGIPEHQTKMLKLDGSKNIELNQVIKFIGI